MNYDEFIHISGESYNDVSIQQYQKEIEPAYMALPVEIVKDKEAFCKWWNKNRELCAFISKQYTQIYELGKQLASTSATLQEKDAQLKDANDVIKNQFKTTEKLGREVTILKLRAAFAPEKLTNQMRLAFFEEYEEAKKTAKEYGII